MITVTSAVVGILSVNCYVVYCDETKKGIVIDPGANINKITNMIESTGIELQAVVLTHSHFDHATHAEDLKEKYGVPIIMHENEAEVFADTHKNLSSVYMSKPFVGKADILLKDGDEIRFGNEKLRVIYTPGHTVGSMSLYAPGYLFSGDTLFAGTHGRTDFETGDPVSLARSLKRLLELPDDTRVFPGHNVFTAIGDEKSSNYMARALIENYL